jgi:hypothetical protein
MSSPSNPKYCVNLSFETIKLPPVTDILVLARKHPQGKNGVMESFKFIAPDEFEMFEIGEESHVEAVLINKKIMKKLPAQKIIEILKTNVFPYISEGEAVKVDFSVAISFNSILGEF